MTAIISDNQILMDSLINKSNGDIDLGSKKILGWKCGKCFATWKESVVNRQKYTFCPLCEHVKGARRGKVTLPEAVKDKPLVKRKKLLKTSKLCDICCSDSKNFVKCELCDYECCSECLKTYVLGSNDIFRCMNMECGKPFSQKALAENYTKKWLKDKKTGYVSHLMKIYLESEKAKLPGTLSKAPLYKELIEINKEDNKLNNKLAEAVKSGNKALQLQIYDMFDENRERHDNIEMELFDTSRIQEEEKFIQGCPSQDCRGLINTKFFCPICNVQICKTCRIVLTEDHKCDPNDIASVKSMKQNTKPCPKCAASIYKIDGCDQMFCVECKTAFSWNTGKIERGNIHNPHYFEYLRSTGGDIPRAPGDVPCGGVPTQQEFILALDNHMSETDNSEEYKYWTVIFGRILVFTNTQLKEVIRENIDEDIKIFIIYRLQYITNHISEENWKRLVFDLERHIRGQEINIEIFDSLRIVLGEKMIQFYKDLREKEDATVEMKTFQKEVDEIRKYFNQCILDENACEKNDCIRVIGPEWEIMSQDEILRGFKNPERQTAPRV